MAEMSLKRLPVSNLTWALATPVKKYLLNREAGLPDHLGSSSRGKNADILLDEAFGQVEKAGLVVNRDDGDALPLRALVG